QQAEPGAGTCEVIQGRERAASEQVTEQVPGTGGGRGPLRDGAAREALGRENRQDALREKQVTAERRDVRLGQGRRASGIRTRADGKPEDRAGLPAVDRLARRGG